MSEMSDAIDVRPAARPDTAVVADVLADAFAEDPVMAWLLPPGIRNRHHRLTSLFANVTQSYLRHDKTVQLAGDGRGAAIWAPPGTWAPTTSDTVRDLLPMLAIFGTRIGRASTLASAMAGSHPHSPRHWYLYCLGTRTTAQSQGIGSAMLREVLDKADAAGEPAYLESSNVRNVPLYERHGFAVVEELHIAGNGPTLWRMWRDPAS
jgi:ribosomal protein S18 acetylase RimI-like enzyme